MIFKHAQLLQPQIYRNFISSETIQESQWKRDATNIQIPSLNWKKHNFS